MPWTEKVRGADLRSDHAAGMTITEMAKKHGISVPGIHKRIRHMGLATVSALSQPAEGKQFATETLDAWTNLNATLTTSRKLLKACDKWLKDANNPEEYDIGARDSEVEITHSTWETVGGKSKLVIKKEKLSVLLARLEDNGVVVEKAEFKHADPRELILSTAQEVRMTVQVAANIARMLADARAMEKFREAMVAAIREVDEETAERIVASVRRSILLRNAADGLREDKT